MKELNKIEVIKPFIMKFSLEYSRFNKNIINYFLKGNNESMKTNRIKDFKGILDA